MTPSRHSLPATCLALLAMLTLLATTRLTAWPLLVCMGALVATHLTPARLSPSSYLPLLLRGLLFPAIFFLSSSASFGIDWLFEPSTMQMLGQIAAIELCVQHWKHTPNRDAGRFPISSLLLSSLVYLAGADIYAYGGPYITPLTPLFVLLLLWSLLDWKPVQMAARAWRVVILCWAGSIAGGYGLYAGSMVFKNELMGLGSQLFRESVARQVAGMSDQPRLGSRFDLPDSPRRILRIQGDLLDPHLRAASFDRYENGAWGPSLSSNERRLDQNKTEATLRADLGPNSRAARAGLVRARVTRLAEMEREPVFVPLNTAALRATESTEIEGPTYDFEPFSGLLRSSEPNPFTYDVIQSKQSIAGVSTFQGPVAGSGAPLTTDARRKYLQLPPGFDPRVIEIANEATLDADTPQARVESLARYLMSTHHYSKQIKIDSARGPISQFIVDKKDAHCEFFAAALALMCRAVQVPSRYVVGYLAHEVALGEPGVTNVRQRDAHAWVEVWIDGVGWVTADATPGEGRPEAREEVAPTQKWGEWASDLLVRIRNWAGSIPRNTWGWVIGVPLGLWLLIRGRPQARARAARDARGYAMPEGEAALRLEALARDFERWMGSRKLAPPPSRSWGWFLRREQKDAAARWAEEYEQARFGRADEDRLARLEEDLRELKARG